MNGLNAYNLKNVTDCNCNYKLKLTLQCCSIVTKKTKKKHYYKEN